MPKLQSWASQLNGQQKLSDMNLPMQEFIPDAKDALTEVDVLKDNTLSEMEKLQGRKESSPG